MIVKINRNKYPSSRSHRLKVSVFTGILLALVYSSGENSIIVQLYSPNGFGFYKITNKGNWSHTWDDQDYFDGDGDNYKVNSIFTYPQDKKSSTDNNIWIKSGSIPEFGFDGIWLEDEDKDKKEYSLPIYKGSILTIPDEEAAKKLIKASYDDNNKVITLKGGILEDICSLGTFLEYFNMGIQCTVGSDTLFKYKGNNNDLTCDSEQKQIGIKLDTKFIGDGRVTLNDTSNTGYTLVEFNVIGHTLELDDIIRLDEKNIQITKEVSKFHFEVPFIVVLNDTGEFNDANLFSVYSYYHNNLKKDTITPVYDKTYKKGSFIWDIDENKIDVDNTINLNSNLAIGYLTQNEILKKTISPPKLPTDNKIRPKTHIEKGYTKIIQQLWLYIFVPFALLIAIFMILWLRQRKKKKSPVQKSENRDENVHPDRKHPGQPVIAQQSDNTTVQLPLEKKVSDDAFEPPRNTREEDSLPNERLFKEKKSTQLDNTQFGTHVTDKISGNIDDRDMAIKSVLESIEELKSRIKRIEEKKLTDYTQIDSRVVDQLGKWIKSMDDEFRSIRGEIGELKKNVEQFKKEIRESLTEISNEKTSNTFSNENGGGTLINASPMVEINQILDKKQAYIEYIDKQVENTETREKVKKMIENDFDNVKEAAHFIFQEEKGFQPNFNKTSQLLIALQRFREYYPKMKFFVNHNCTPQRIKRRITETNLLEKLRQSIKEDTGNEIPWVPLFSIHEKGQAGKSNLGITKWQNLSEYFSEDWVEKMKYYKVIEIVKYDFGGNANHNILVYTTGY